MEEVTTKVKKIAHQSGQKIAHLRRPSEHADIHVTPGAHQGGILRRATSHNLHKEVTTEYADISVTPGAHRRGDLSRATSYCLQQNDEDANEVPAYHSSHQDRKALGLASNEHLNYHEHVYARWFGILRHYKLLTLVHAHRLLDMETDPSISRRIRRSVLELLSFW
jgi:hypothetical protein